MKKYIIIVAAVLVVIALAIFIRSGSTTTVTNQQNMDTTTEDPLDAVLEFYNDWLDAEQSTTTDPIQAGLLDRPAVSPELRSYIEAGRVTLASTELDPIFCQSVTPERVGAKVLYVNESNAQVIVLARGLEEKSPFQSVVTLKAADGAWVMSSIECSQGEVAPEREYDFERPGFLLKSVPPPLNSDFWHLVYEENNVMGHTVPLAFTDASICIAADGTESACDESTFSEATQVTLQADMTESGAIVRRLQF